jgi:hypothetical protein
MTDEIKTSAEDRVHHPYSPSTLQSLEACPCYEGRSESHIRAIAGTKMHKVTEDRVDDDSLDDDDALMAAECIDFWEGRKQLMLEKGPIVELAETYLPIDDLEFEGGTQSTTAGYFDGAIIDYTEKYCEGVDYKFGLWAVEKVKNNLQVFSYVLGLFKKFPKLETIRFFIKQPAIGFLDDHVFHRNEIPVLLLRISVVVERARVARKTGNFSTANATIPNCLFCRHLGICPVVTTYAVKIGNKFSPLKIPDSVTPSMIQDPANTSLGMQLAQVMKVWSEAFRKVTCDRVLRGAPLPDGYELKSRAGSRKVTNLPEFKKYAMHYLTEEEFNSTLEVGLGAVEDAIGFKQPRGSKKKAIQDFKVVIEQAEVVERGREAVFLQAVNKE